MIVGPSLSIRPIEKEDLKIWNQLNNDTREASPFWPLFQRSPATEAKDFEETGFIQEDFGIFLIIDKSDQRILGSIAYMKQSRYQTGYEIGYRLFKKKDFGKGYMTEALRYFSAFLFSSRDIPRVYVCVDVKNIGSRRVAEKCGFKHEGVLRKAAFIHGRYIDMDQLSLLKEESPVFLDLLESSIE